MHCPACNASIRATARFCTSCGAPISNAAAASTQRRAEELPPNMAAPAPPPPEEIARQRAAAEQFIDSFLREGGVSDPASLADEQGRRYFRFGSVRCRAAIIEEEGHFFLHADAYVMDLPSDAELIVPLMRELLELNLVLRGAVRVGISDEAVIAMAIRPLIEMDHDEFTSCISSVMNVADQIDDLLLEKYGGTARQRDEG
jgi:hypothetical protein